MSTTVAQIKALAAGNLPDNFLKLQDYLLWLLPIHTKIGYNKALVAVQKLAPRKDLSRIQRSYLESLANNIKAYEDMHFPISKENPIDMLKFLLEENDMNGSDLGNLLGQRQLGSKILRGERSLSKKHIRILAKHFSVDPSLFLE